jgi:hypothetical protein
LSFEQLAKGSCLPLAFVIARPGKRFGRTNARRFLSSPLVVVRKGLKPTRNRSVGHGLGSAKQSLCFLQVSLASL